MRREVESGGRALRLQWVAAIAWMCLLACSCTPFKDGRVRARDAGADTDASNPDAGCAEDGDCPAAGPCTAVTCKKGVCVIEPVRDGAALPAEMQVEGDCKKVVCDGDGNDRSETDDGDVQSDGNPCHEVRCSNGTREVADKPDGAPCNVAGTCQAGRCSECNAGAECPRPTDCTVYRWVCVDGVAECEDTGVPRPGRACEAGKVCHEGSCIPCVVGAPCDVDLPCYAGRISSCDQGRHCELVPQTGMACGQDSTGNPMYCVGGRCMSSCAEGPCMSASGPCRTSVSDCSGSSGEPRCVEVALPDGSSCGEASVCQSGECVGQSLINGDFRRGLEGWQTSGDGASFPIAIDEAIGDRPSLTTSPEAMGGAARGSVAQSFRVPSDALALRYVIWGGRAVVRLKDESGEVLVECPADQSNERIAVSWDLSDRRGQRLTLAIEDELGSGEWAFVAVSGFDVIRDVAGPLRNSQWGDGFDGWETSGDGLNFNLFDDVNHNSRECYGRRRSLSTYARSPAAANLRSASRGTVSQLFMVPSDAVAIRFNIHGGRVARVRLLDGSKELYRETGRDSDFIRLPVSWNLEPFRGKPLRLTIEDDQTTIFYGYVGTSGFDVITSYNGP